MEVSTREAERIFSKLKVQPRRSTHHVAGVVVIDGIARLPVHYSRGRKGLHGRAAQMFRKSLHLEPDEFAVLKGCTMSRAEFVAIVGPRIVH
jgi:hypothetical protein